MSTDRLFNAHDQLKAAVADGVLPREQAVAIGEDWTQDRRPVIDGWRVESPFFETDPQAHWSDHGRKTFSHHWHRDYRATDQRRARKEAHQRALEEAKRWTGEQYGVTDWKRNREGQYVPAVVQERYPLPKREP